jgi:hypothetical protein
MYHCNCKDGATDNIDCGWSHSDKYKDEIGIIWGSAEFDEQ